MGGDGRPGRCDGGPTSRDTTLFSFPLSRPPDDARAQGCMYRLYRVRSVACVKAVEHSNTARTGAEVACTGTSISAAMVPEDWIQNSVEHDYLSPAGDLQVCDALISSELATAVLRRLLRVCDATVQYRAMSTRPFIPCQSILVSSIACVSSAPGPSVGVVARYHCRYHHLRGRTLAVTLCAPVHHWGTRGRALPIPPSPMSWCSPSPCPCLPLSALPAVPLSRSRAVPRARWTPHALPGSPIYQVFLSFPASRPPPRPIRVRPFQSALQERADTRPARRLSRRNILLDHKR
ncbi:hypothetical protein ANO11243_096620 [Dothideomycetidae sp. 11243]|nr:hypothetical protein ANO11243_096620 [fungal sp. No.11243]